MNSKQGNLFGNYEKLMPNQVCEKADEYIEIYEKHKIKYEILKFDDVTFKGGVKEPVHSWFRLTPSYSPEIVRFFINHFKINKKNRVLDPFCGKGTTLIECQKQGIKSVGIELNPLFSNVIRWSLEWDKDFKVFKQEKDKIKSKFLFYKRKYKKLNIEDFSSKTKIEIPKIHNVFRWWKKDVLKDLLILKNVINLHTNNDFINYYNLILSVISLDCANIHRNHPTISFDDNHSRDIDVWKEFSKNYSKIAKDLEFVFKYKPISKAEIVEGDSVKLSKYIKKQKINFLITSPPYPNRFSYIHQTRPQLFFMNLIDDATDATEIDLKAIGGTWGRATSILQKEFLEPNKEIADILDYISELKPKSILMCNYATKYFNMMHNHIKELKKNVEKGFKGVYVVGNSRLTGVEIHTEIILGRIFEREGFNFDKIIVFRKRGGRKKLYETGTCISL